MGAQRSSAVPAMSVRRGESERNLWRLSLSPQHLRMEEGERVSICIGVGNDICGVEFFDPDFPNDNVCDQCATRLVKEGEGEV